MPPLPLLWRTIVLRTVLSSIVACLISSLVSCLQAGWCPPEIGASVYTPLVFTLLHHVFRLWAPSWWWNITDVLCCLAEVGGGAFTIYYLWTQWISLSPNFSGDLALGVSWSILGASIFLNFFILLWDTTTNRGRTLLQRYDFSAGLESDRPGRQWNFIFGTFTLKKRFNTDNRPIQWVRGGLAILCLVGLSFTIFYVFVGRPLWQRSNLVTRISKIPRDYLSQDESESTAPLEVNVAVNVPRLKNLQDHAPKPFMNIDGRRWWTNTSTINSGMDPMGQGNTTKCYDNGDWSQTQTCYSVVKYTLVDELDIVELHPELFHPSYEVLITVDFSAFGNASQLPFQVGLYPAVSNSTAISERTSVYLGPGSHFYAISFVSFKEKSSNQGFAFLGIPKFSRIPILNVGHLFPDLSPSFPNNTASLRLFFPRPEEVQIERDYFEGSLVDGLATIGGIWTFMNGLFATIFGCTLLLVLFGIKPLSVYGLVHLVQPKSSLVGQDRTLSQEDRDWILEVLSQHLLDDGIKASQMLQSHKSEPKDDEKEYEEAEYLVKHGSVGSA